MIKMIDPQPRMTEPTPLGQLQLQVINLETPTMVFLSLSQDKENKNSQKCEPKQFYKYKKFTNSKGYKAVIFVDFDGG